MRTVTPHYKDPEDWTGRDLEDFVTESGMDVEGFAQSIGSTKGIITKRFETGPVEEIAERIFHTHIMGQSPATFESARDNRVADLINHHISHGVNTQAELLELTGITYYHMRKLRSKRKINIEFKAGLKKGQHVQGKLKGREEWLDRQVENLDPFKSYDSVAALFTETFGQTITRSAIGQYIEKTGQLEKWEQSKRVRVNAAQSIVDILTTNPHRLLHTLIYRSSQLTGEKGLECIYARETTDVHRQRVIGRAINGAKLYLELREELGGEPTTSDIARRRDISTGSAIAWRQNLMRYGFIDDRRRRSVPRLPKRTISDEVKEQIKELESLGYLSRKDISYFIGIDIPHSSFSKAADKKKTIIATLGNYKLNYRDTPEIFGFSDMGCTNREISSATDIPISLVRHALAHRRTIEPRVIQAYQIVHPHETITLPYR